MKEKFLLSKQQTYIVDYIDTYDIEAESLEEAVDLIKEGIVDDCIIDCTVMHECAEPLEDGVYIIRDDEGNILYEK